MNKWFLKEQHISPIDMKKFRGLLILKRMENPNFISYIDDERLEQDNIGSILNGVGGERNSSYRDFTTLVREIVLPSLIELTEIPNDNYMYFTSEDEDYIVRFYINHNGIRDFDILISNMKFDIYKYSRSSDEMEFIDEYGKWVGF
jgi:hypothetical protein